MTKGVEPVGIVWLQLIVLRPEVSVVDHNASEIENFAAIQEVE
jgi:hypothetical protein